MAALLPKCLRHHAQIQEFSSGGSRSVWQKNSDSLFFVFFLSQMVNFKEIYHFSRFQRGSNIFQGGGGVQLFAGVQLLIPYRDPCPDPLSPLWIRTFSRGGGGGGGVQLFPGVSNCLFPIETHVRTPCPPLWIRTWSSPAYGQHNVDQQNLHLPLYSTA